MNPIDPTTDLPETQNLESTTDTPPSDIEKEVDESSIPVLAMTPEIEVTEFESLALESKLIETVNTLGWKAPTKIQGMCLPYTLSGRDLAGFAQTGTGKTGVFLITIAHRILLARKEGLSTKPFAVVLSPTRELAMQIENDAQSLFEPLGISSIAVFGGVEYDKQARQLQDGVDVIVATPGRLKDFIQKKVVNISDTKLFICDEADRMFDMGFIEDVKFFLNKLTEGCQKLLFSATTNDSVRELAFEYLDKPEYISAQPDSITPEKIQQHAIICESVNKFKVILSLLRRDKPNCSIVFTNTKAAAEWLHFKLNGNGLDTDLITGDLPQRKRIALIKRIKEGEVKALIATDVASRGLHIGAVTHVYNFDLPNEASNYVHRIGRTARAGATGTAISLVCEDYGENLRAINTLLGPLAMKSEWYDPSFLEVTDLAGSPPRAARREGSGGDRGQQRRSGGGDRHRGPSGQNRGRPQGPRGAGPQRGDRPTNRQEHASGASAERHGRPQRPQQTADQRRSGPSSRPQHQQQNRPNRPGQQQQHQQRPKPVQPPMTATKKVPIPEQKTGFVSLVKKLVKTIFG